VFSVPATYSEAFGLYVLEAMAAGVPVAQPRASAFPEIVLAAGGGVLHEPGDPESLADSWEMLLANPAKARELGRKGRAAVENSMPAMARAFVQQTAFPSVSRPWPTNLNSSGASSSPRRTWRGLSISPTFSG
jgi:hypothetical protein